MALYDWCWGGDDQWLYSEPDDRKLYSHDHGWYLPDVGPNWDESSLARCVDMPHVAPYPEDGLNATELERLASRLESISRDEIRLVLSEVPVSWPVTDAQLESLGYFLERRAAAVATRLRTLKGV